MGATGCLPAGANTVRRDILPFPDAIELWSAGKKSPSRLPSIAKTLEGGGSRRSNLHIRIVHCSHERRLHCGDLRPQSSQPSRRRTPNAGIPVAQRGNQPRRTGRSHPGIRFHDSPTHVDTIALRCLRQLRKNARSQPTQRPRRRPRNVRIVRSDRLAQCRCGRVHVLQGNAPKRLRRFERPRTMGISDSRRQEGNGSLMPRHSPKGFRQIDPIDRVVALETGEHLSNGRSGLRSKTPNRSR